MTDFPTVSVVAEYRSSIPPEPEPPEEGEGGGGDDPPPDPIIEYNTWARLELLSESVAEGNGIFTSDLDLVYVVGQEVSAYNSLIPHDWLDRRPHSSDLTLDTTLWSRSNKNIISAGSNLHSYSVGGADTLTIGYFSLDVEPDPAVVGQDLLSGSVAAEIYIYDSPLDETVETSTRFAMVTLLALRCGGEIPQLAIDYMNQYDSSEEDILLSEGIPLPIFSDLSIRYTFAKSASNVHTVSNSDGWLDGGVIYSPDGISYVDFSHAIEGGYTETGDTHFSADMVEQRFDFGGLYGEINRTGIQVDDGWQVSGTMSDESLLSAMVYEQPTTTTQSNPEDPLDPSDPGLPGSGTFSEPSGVDPINLAGDVTTSSGGSYFNPDGGSTGGTGGMAATVATVGSLSPKSSSSISATSIPPAPKR